MHLYQDVLVLGPLNGFEAVVLMRGRHGYGFPTLLLKVKGLGL